MPLDSKQLLVSSPVGATLIVERSRTHRVGLESVAVATAGLQAVRQVVDLDREVQRRHALRQLTLAMWLGVKFLAVVWEQELAEGLFFVEPDWKLPRAEMIYLVRAKDSELSRIDHFEQLLEQLDEIEKWSRWNLVFGSVT